MKELQKLLAEREIPFHSDDNRIMCFPHIVNIATQRVLKALTNPAFMGDSDEDSEDDGGDQTQSGSHASAAASGAGEEDNLGGKDNEAQANDGEDHDGEDNDENSDDDNDSDDADDDLDDADDDLDDDEEDAGNNNAMRSGASNYDDACKEDPINLCRKVARAVRASGMRRDEFDEMITNGNVKGWFKVDGQVVQVSQLQLLLDMKIRWDSTFIMLKRFIELQPVSVL